MTTFKFSMLVTAFLAFSACQQRVFGLPTREEERSWANGTFSDIEARALAPIYTTCLAANEIALTFDDGPYIYLRELSDTLTNAGVKGTFFWNGNNWDCIYDSARVADVHYVISKGHEIAQHTWSHPYLTSLSLTEIRTEFSRINTALKKITGLTPTFFRPPYGDYNNNVRQVAAENGQSVVTWNYDSGDSDGYNMAYQKGVYSSFITKKDRKGIFLNHETYQSTVQTLLPYAIAELKKGGYNFVTLSQCLGKAPYLSTVKPSTRDSTWHC